MGKPLKIAKSDSSSGLQRDQADGPNTVPVKSGTPVSASGARSGTTVTLTFASGPVFNTGRTISVNGFTASRAVFNGEWTITGATATTVTFTHPTSGTIANGGTGSIAQEISGTNYLGGVGGNPDTSSRLTIACTFKDASGNTYTDGWLVRQKGRKTFLVQSQSGGASTLTRATLVPSGTLANGQMNIQFLDNTGTPQYATRITNNYVYNTAKFRYATVSSFQFTFENAQDLQLTFDGVPLAMVLGI